MYLTINSLTFIFIKLCHVRMCGGWLRVIRSEFTGFAAGSARVMAGDLHIYVLCVWSTALTDGGKL